MVCYRAASGRPAYRVMIELALRALLIDTSASSPGAATMSATR